MRAPEFAPAIAHLERDEWPQGFDALSPMPDAYRAPREDDATRITWTEDMTWLLDGGHAHEH